jgi:hypothetical protein
MSWMNGMDGGYVDLSFSNKRMQKMVVYFQRLTQCCYNAGCWNHRICGIIESKEQKFIDHQYPLRHRHRLE